MNKFMEILLRYPVRNDAWSVGTSIFVTEMSDLTMGGRITGTDPWGRVMPQFGMWEPFVDPEGEIAYWMTSTTVNGARVGLCIFND
jgi:hypothetical protein